ncbi:MAG: hypothetical protein ACRDGS_07150 [Chloroflexota bacterium]
MTCIDTLRNMTRRKTRTGLTVLGIVIRVLALTVMGAMAEKMDLLVAVGTRLQPEIILPCALKRRIGIMYRWRTTDD